MSDISKKLYYPYKILLIFYMISIIFAFCVNTPKDIFEGLIKIINTNDVLITDYIELSNFGSSLLNLSIIGLCMLFIVYFIKLKPTGAIIMAFWLTNSFAFFGKNIYNIWPSILGVYLFSKHQKKPFENYILVAFLSASLAPVVSQISILEQLKGYNNFVAISISILIGISIGFIMPAISSATIKFHGGYSLYNVGLSAGLVSTLYYSIAKSFGIEVTRSNIWGTSNKIEIGIYIYIVSIFFILVGFYKNKRNIWQDFKNITNHSGRLVTDYYIMYDKSSYINMGILGIFACTYTILIGGDLNGPTMGGIFSILGFGIFGKNLKNIIPVMIGATICAHFNVLSISSPGNILGILFSTCLAPIAGQFGVVWGMIAGFVHIGMVSNIGNLHGGLNLYNNGYTAGIVAAILVPIITALKRDDKIDT